MGQCNTCNNLENSTSSPFSVEVSYSNLASSARNGCRNCALLFEGISSFIPTSSELPYVLSNQPLSSIDAIRMLKRSWEKSPPPPTIIHGNPLGEADMKVTAEYSSKTFVLKTVDEDTIAKVEFYTHTALWGLVKRNTASSVENTASDESFSRVLDWLKKCNDCHYNCRPGFKRRNHGVELNTLPRPPTRLPTRVLDVGLGEDDIVKLHTTRNESAPYICLSHCWGASQLITTTSKNLRAHKEEIPWSSLSKTFQDSVLITRKLNIRYLWIDSLCILQDSQQDWRWESVRMASVYKNSFLTLAATKSASGDGGLFSIPPPDKQPCILTGSHENGTKYQIYVRQAIPHLQWAHFLNLNYETHEIQISRHCPLLSRAWVFQERILSPRVLHFTERELSWECNEEMDCECSNSQLMINMKYEHTCALTSQANMRSLTDEWHKMVEEYTRLKLSHPGDRLPALSGLAQELQHRGKGEYLAGLFKDSLLDDLLWQVDLQSSSSSGRVEQWIAPTWSWASIKSKVASFERIGKSALCQVLEAKCIPADLIAGPTGCLTAGHIKISGLVIPATLAYPQPFSLRDAKNIPWYYKIAKDGYDFQVKSFYADYQLGEKGKTHIFSGQTVHCLCIGRSGGLTFAYLVLHCLDFASQTYERIGCCSVLQMPEDLLDSQQRKSIVTIV